MKKANYTLFVLFSLCFCLCLGFTGCSSESGDAGQTDTEGYSEASADGGEEQLAAESSEEETIDWASEEQEVISTLPVYDYEAMDKVLAPLVAMMRENNMSRFTRAQADTDMAARYLYIYENLFHAESAEQLTLQAKKGSYIQLDTEGTEVLLQNVFGDGMELNKLQADDEMIIKKGKNYYVTAGEIPSVTVVYSGFENEGFTELSVYSFDYELQMEDNRSEEGIVQVKFQESEETDSGITLNVVAVTPY